MITTWLPVSAFQDPDVSLHRAFARLAEVCRLGIPV
jgi:hypothetical protein